MKWDHSGFLSKKAIGAASQLILLWPQLDSAAAGNHWLMVFDAVAVPNDGTAPTFSPIPVTVGGFANLDFTGVNGYRLTNGIAWALSSTQATLTTSADTVWVDACYA